MIHTLVLSLALACYDTRLMSVLPFFVELRRRGTGIAGIKAQVRNQQAPYGFSSFIGVYCNLHIDALLLTGRRNLDTPGDYQLIADTVDKLLAPVKLTIRNMAVYRIDYCYNAYVPDGQTRELLMRLWSKCDLSGGSLRVEKYSAAHPEANPGLNDAYFHNHKRTTQVYDKKTERNDNGKKPSPMRKIFCVWNTRRFLRRSRPLEISAIGIGPMITWPIPSCPGAPSCFSRETSTPSGRRTASWKERVSLPPCGRSCTATW